MIKVDRQKKILNFYKINFYNWTFNKIINRVNLGGYLVAPAASALTEILSNKEYYKSLKDSQCAIFDSGFFCLLLSIFRIYNPKKFSGYLFLKKFLAYKNAKKKKILLVNSTDYQGEKNIELLHLNKFKKVFLYTSPFYKNKNIKDRKLLNFLNKLKPNYIIMCIGGGKQEPLALFINKKIKFRCAILCLGGAIDFINGLQAPINEFIDKIYLGWLMRIIFNPEIFFVRVLRSINLIFFFLKKNNFN
jgi:UDP-N-acetyl-D-mannosaminuronic acid transferase (WecB/TagA/CpsF family)